MMLLLSISNPQPHHKNVTSLHPTLSATVKIAERMECSEQNFDASVILSYKLYGVMEDIRNDDAFRLVDEIHSLKGWNFSYELHHDDSSS